MKVHLCILFCVFAAFFAVASEIEKELISKLMTVEGTSSAAVEGPVSEEELDLKRQRSLTRADQIIKDNFSSDKTVALEAFGDDSAERLEQLRKIFYGAWAEYPVSLGDLKLYLKGTSEGLEALFKKIVFKRLGKMFDIEDETVALRLLKDLQDKDIKRLRTLLMTKWSRRPAKMEDFDKISALKLYKPLLENLIFKTYVVHIAHSRAVELAALLGNKVADEWIPFRIASASLTSIVEGYLMDLKDVSKIEGNITAPGAKKARIQAVRKGVRSVVSGEEVKAKIAELHQNMENEKLFTPSTAPTDDEPESSSDKEGQETDEDLVNNHENSEEEHYDGLVKSHESDFNSEEQHDQDSEKGHESDSNSEEQHDKDLEKGHGSDSNREEQHADEVETETIKEDVTYSWNQTAVIIVCVLLVSIAISLSYKFFLKKKEGQ